MSYKHKYKTLKSRSKASGGPPPPKRNLSAYFIFNNEQRPILQRENPEKRVTEISKEIAVLYKQLSPQEMKKYQDLAVKDKQRYEREMDDYQLKLSNRYNSHHHNGKARKPSHHDYEEEEDDDEEEDEDEEDEEARPPKKLKSR